MSHSRTQTSELEKTVTRPISFIGVGLHTGRKVAMQIKPAAAGTGIHFLRKDVAPGKGLIVARWYNVVDTRLSTTLGNEFGITVATVEHLLAALRGCGIDNAMVELDGPEVPIMDGSSAVFVRTLEKVGSVAQPQQRNVIWIQQPIEVREDDRYALLMPHDSTRITVEIDFPDSRIRSQSLSVEMINEAFRNDVAHARTFGFRDQIDALRRQGLVRGGSLQNAILVDGDRIVNEEGLRYENEFVRHKILDCYGDMALLGMPVMGHLFALKPGHSLNHALIKALFENRSHWSYLTMDDFLQFSQAQRQQRQNPDVNAIASRLRRQYREQRT